MKRLSDDSPPAMKNPPRRGIRRKMEMYNQKQ
jgi:hypothetical protein